MKKKRLTWARKFKDWTEDEWKHALQTQMGGDNPKNLGNELSRLVETLNLFNWEYRIQFMYPKLPTTTQKNENGLTHY